MPEARYQVIADDLRRQIESGQLVAGSRLPTEAELQEKYVASRNTVRDAIKSLVTRGLIETRPGQGTFVTETIIPLVTTLTGDPETASGGEGRTYSQEVKARLRIPSDTSPKVGAEDAAIVAPELQITDASGVVSRHQERSIDGTPWSLQTSFYPMRFVQLGAFRLLQPGNIDEGTVDYLRDSLGIKQAGYRDQIIVRAPNENETRFFKLPADGRISVIETRRTAYDDEGSPIRLTVSVYPADRNQFVLDVGKVPVEIKDPLTRGTGEPPRAADVPSDPPAPGSG